MEAKHGLHESSRNLRKLFVCAECGLKYRTLEQLHDHHAAAASKRGHIPHMWVAETPGHIPACEVCQKVFDDHDALEQHFVSSHAVKQLKRNDKEKIEQERQFLASWKKETGETDTARVLYVRRRESELTYVRPFVQPEACTNESNSHGSGRSEDNEMLLYHGTSLTCKLGSEEQQAKLCNHGRERNCNMCSILRQEFKVTKADANKWQRFDLGIYTTPYSGKSDDYIPPNAQRRAVFVCKVLTGRKFQTYTNSEDLKAPPSGYDSVWGKPGVDLNYDEYAVYNSKAILPKYIIVYRKYRKPHPNVDARLHQNEVEYFDLAQRICTLGGLDGW